MILLVPIAYVVLRKFNGRSRYDRILGNLAYPLFLDHILCLSITNKTHMTIWHGIFVFVFLAVAISSMIAVFQSGVDRWRYRQRGFGALARLEGQHVSIESRALIKA